MQKPWRWLLEKLGRVCSCSGRLPCLTCREPPGGLDLTATSRDGTGVHRRPAAAASRNGQSKPAGGRSAALPCLNKPPPPSSRHFIAGLRRRLPGMRIITRRTFREVDSHAVEVRPSDDCNVGSDPTSSPQLVYLRGGGWPECSEQRRRASPYKQQPTILESSGHMQMMVPPRWAGHAGSCTSALRYPPDARMLPPRRETLLPNTRTTMMPLMLPPRRDMLLPNPNGQRHVAAGVQSLPGLRFRRRRPAATVRIIISAKTKTFSLDVNPSYTVGDVKLMIERKIGKPAFEQRLLFSGQVLRDDWRTLAEYDLQEQPTLYLVSPLRGGGGPCPDHYYPETSNGAGSSSTAARIEPSDSSAIASAALEQHGHLVLDLRGSIEQGAGSDILRQQDGEEEDTSADRNKFPLEPAVSVSHGARPQLQASVLAAAADVFFFSVSLDVAVGPADLIVRRTVVPFLSVILLRTTFLPFIYWIIVQLREPLEQLLHIAAEMARNRLLPWLRGLLEEPIIREHWGFLAEALKAAMLALLYALAPHWLNVKLKLKPELSKMSATWETLRRQALDWLSQSLAVDEPPEPSVPPVGALES